MVPVGVPSTMYSARKYTMITCANSPLAGRGGAPNQDVGLSLGHWAKRAAPRANRAPSPACSSARSATSNTVEPPAYGRWPPRRRRDACSATNEDTVGASSDLIVAPDSGLHQQPTQQRVALLADVTQAALVSTGVFGWNQAQVAGQFLLRGNRFQSPMVST